MAPEARVEFLITGSNVDFDKVTATLGLRPSRTWRAGDVISGTQLRRKTDAWVLAGQDATGSDLVASVSEILTRLEPIASKVGALVKRQHLEAELSCAVYVNGASPEIHLDPEQVDQLAALRAALDIDVIVTE